MKPDRPSKNLITTLPSDGVGDDDVGQVLRQVLALDVALEPEPGLHRAARSPAGSGHRPCPSPRRSRAAPRAGSRTPRTRSAKIAPIWAYWARFSAVESGLAPMSSRTKRSGVGDHLDRQRRPIDAGQAAQPEDRRGHAGAGVPGGDDGVGLAAP